MMKAKIQLQDVIKTAVVNQSVIEEIFGVQKEEGRDAQPGKISDFLSSDESVKEIDVYDRDGHIIIKYESDISWPTIVNIRKLIRGYVDTDKVYSRIGFTFAPSEIASINERSSLCLITDIKNDQKNKGRYNINPVVLKERYDKMNPDKDEEFIDIDSATGEMFIERKHASKAAILLCATLIKRTEETAVFRIYLGMIKFSEGFANLTELLTTYTFRVEYDEKRDESFVNIMKPLKDKLSLRRQFFLMAEVEESLMRMSKILLKKFDEPIDIDPGFADNEELLQTVIVNPKLITSMDSQGYVGDKNRRSKYGVIQIVKGKERQEKPKKEKKFDISKSEITENNNDNIQDSQRDVEVEPITP